MDMGEQDADLTLEESVNGIINGLEKISKNDSGSFIRYMLHIDSVKKAC